MHCTYAYKTKGVCKEDKEEQRQLSSGRKIGMSGKDYQLHCKERFN